MRVELRRGVAIDRPGGVMLEDRAGELARQLRGIHVAKPALGVPFQLTQSDTDTVPVHPTDPVVAFD